MKSLVSKRWVVLALGAPLLMGAKGGCGGEVSMGSDDAGSGGMVVDEGGEGGDETVGGSGAMGGAGAVGGRGGRGGRGGAGGNGGSGAIDGMGATGGSAGEGPVICTGFENESPTNIVTVRYVNASAEALYIGRTHLNCGPEDEAFRLQDAAGERLDWLGGDCVTCERLQNGPPSCPANCDVAELVRIDPGGSYDFTWNGVYLEREEMPAECYGPMSPVFDQCSRIVAAPPALYRFAGTAWTEFSCDPADMCPCIPTETDSCLIPGPSIVAGTSREASATLGFPMQDMVELRFE